MNFLPSILVTVISIAIGLRLLFKENLRDLVKTYAYFLILVGTWTIVDFIQIIPIYVLFKPIDWVKLFYVFGVFVPPVYLHFILQFIELKKLKLKLFVPYLISVAFLLANIVSYQFVEKVVYSPKTKILSIESGVYLDLFFVYLLSTLIASAFLVGWKYLKALEPLKTQLRLYGFATLFIFVAVISFVTIFTKLGNFRIDNIFVVIYISFIAYIITKHELLDIKVVVSRSLAILLTFFLVGSSIGVVYFSIKDDAARFVSILIIGFFWSYYARDIQTFLLTTANRKFVKGWYDFQATLANLSESLVSAYSKEKLVGALKENLDEIEFEDVEFVVVSDLEHSNNFFEDKAPVYLRDFQCCSELGIEGEDGVLVPLYSNERIEFVLKIGAKASGAGFTNQDFQLFRTLQKQVILGLDRIRPYEQIKAELEQTMQYAEEANRQAAFGTLTRQIAHEIRNPMIMIKSGADLAYKRFDDKAKVEQYSTMVKNNVERILNIAESILEYGDSGAHKKGATDVKKVIEDVVELSQGKFSEENISATTKVSEIPEIDADNNSIFQVLTNLVLNATEAHAEIDKDGKTLEITCEAATFRNEENQPIEGIRIDVTDNGPGMTEETKGQVLNYFFSTKHEGRGLGLSIAHKIVKDHGGIMDVESTEGNGAIFSVFLPLGHDSNL